MTDEYIPIQQLTDNIIDISRDELSLYFDSYDKVFVSDDEVYQVLPTDDTHADIVRVGYYVSAPKIVLRQFQFNSKTYTLSSCLHHVRDLRRNCASRLTLLELKNATDVFELVFVGQQPLQLNTHNAGQFEVIYNQTYLKDLKDIPFTRSNLMETFIEICLENM